MSFPDPLVLQQIRAYLARRLGLSLAEGAHQAEDAVRLRMKALRLSDARAYLRWLREDDDELWAIAELVTVGETSFFRQPNQFAALMDEVVPARSSAGGPSLRLLSAGCSTGEEPYSIAMLLDLDPPAMPAVIEGTDVNRRALERAREGVYSTWALRATPEAMRGRYFRSVGKRWKLSPHIRDQVELYPSNLLDPKAACWHRGPWDVVFCRNLLIYLDAASVRSLVELLAKSITPGGYLFLGHAETLRGVTHHFELQHSQGAFYYRRARVERPKASPPARWGWRSQIGASAEKIAQISARPGKTAGPTLEPPDRRPPDQVGRVFSLLAAERYDEALALVQTLPTVADPDALLLEAILLAHRGDLAEAVDLCFRVFEVDPLNVGSHYLLAICRDELGDFQGAVEADERAIHLDPSFAMPHLHLGMLHRRAGHKDRAQGELLQAQRLLPGEDASRLLLYGGGFGRDALQALCEAELRAAEGES